MSSPLDESSTEFVLSLVAFGEDSRRSYSEENCLALTFVSLELLPLLEFDFDLKPFVAL